MTSVIGPASVFAYVPVPVWVLLSLTATAACVTLSSFHDGTHADALVPVLASLHKWDLFFWETDRNGQLIPLLARPFTHPLTNLLVQTGLAVFAGLAAAFLLAWYLFRDRNWAAVGGAAAAVFLAAVPIEELYNMLTMCQPYLPPAALALAGTLLLTPAPDRSWPGPARAACGLLLTAAAYWCNVGLAMTIGPIVLGRSLAARWLGPDTPRPRAIREFAFGLGAILFGTAFGQGLRVFASVNDTLYAFSPPARWPPAWAFMAEAALDRLYNYWLVLAGCAAVGVLWLRDPATRPVAVRYWVGAAILVATLLVVLGVTGMTGWAARNAYDIRYLTLAIFVVVVAGAAVAVGPVASRLTEPGRRWAAAALVVVLPGIAVVNYGPPSVAAARGSLDRAAGRWTDDLLAAGCTHVSGDYWSVWPAVFHANMTLANRGEARRVWGVTARSGVTRPLWRAVPPDRTRIGWLVQPDRLWPSGDSADYWRGDYPAVRRVGLRPTLWVYVPDDERTANAK